MGERIVLCRDGAEYKQLYMELEEVGAPPPTRFDVRRAVRQEQATYDKLIKESRIALPITPRIYLPPLPDPIDRHSNFVKRPRRRRI